MGRALRRGLDTDELPDETAARLRGLAAGVIASDIPPNGGVGTAPNGSGGTGTARVGGPDRFAYILEVDGPGGRTVRTFTEPVPDDVKPLVDLMRTAPLLPAPRKRP